MIKNIAVVLIIVIITLLLFDLVYQFIEYPEKYLPTWRYQLQNDVKRGNKDAIEYYERHYAAKGITLWEE